MRDWAGGQSTEGRGKVNIMKRAFRAIAFGGATLAHWLSEPSFPRRRESMWTEVGRNRVNHTPDRPFQLDGECTPNDLDSRLRGNDELEKSNAIALNAL